MFMRFCIFCFALALILSPLSASGSTIDRAGIARVEGVFDRGAGTTSHAWGTGAYLGNHYVLTCAHLFTPGRDDGRLILVRAYFPERRWFSTAQVVRIDTAHDQALIRLTKTIDLAGYPIATTDVAAGDTVTVAGYGSGSLRIHRGIVTGFLDNTGENNRAYFEINTPSVQGDSGGPCFDQQGRLIGNLYATDQASQSTTIALCSWRTRSFCGPLICGPTCRPTAPSAPAPQIVIDYNRLAIMVAAVLVDRHQADIKGPAGPPGPPGATGAPGPAGTPGAAPGIDYAALAATLRSDQQLVAAIVNQITIDQVAPLPTPAPQSDRPVYYSIRRRR
jgi:hypothetical protein